MDRIVDSAGQLEFAAVLFACVKLSTASPRDDYVAKCEALKGGCLFKYILLRMAQGGVELHHKVR